MKVYKEILKLNKKKVKKHSLEKTFRFGKTFERKIK